MSIKVDMSKELKYNKYKNMMYQLIKLIIKGTSGSF